MDYSDKIGQKVVLKSGKIGEIVSVNNYIIVLVENEEVKFQFEAFL